jgi:bacillithiol system protein YtxJ
MNFIKSMFKSEESNQSDAKIQGFPWKPLQDIDQINELLEASKHQTIIIFKHSTRCGTSRAVIKNFEQDQKSRLDVAFYYLDLLNYRAVSNAVASQLQVNHQSPQVIVLKDGAVVAHDSHFDALSLKF